MLEIFLLDLDLVGWEEVKSDLKRSMSLRLWAFPSPLLPCYPCFSFLGDFLRPPPLDIEPCLPPRP